MDWLDDFKSKFNKDIELQFLKRDKKHCKLEINFCEGQVSNYNLTLHRRAEKTNNL